MLAHRRRRHRAALSPFLASNYFDGDWVMVVALIVAFAAYAPAHFARGICSGSGRFRAYAVVMGADGLVRIVLCLAPGRRRRRRRRVRTASPSPSPRWSASATSPARASCAPSPGRRRRGAR